MTYFSKYQDGIERGAKVAADIFCALLIGILAIACFGPVLGLIGFAAVEIGWLSIDLFLPNKDDSPGAVVR